jgi:hypothetical protein
LRLPSELPPRPDEPQACHPAAARTLDTGAEGAAGVADMDTAHAVRLAVKIRPPARSVRSGLFQPRGRAVPRVFTVRDDGLRLGLKVHAQGVTALPALARDPAAGLSFIRC